MTMPHERMRALRWGWELLASLRTDSSIPHALVERAVNLAQTYPTPTALTLMLEADRPQFPEGFGESVDGARALFEEIQSEGYGSAETRRDTLYTLRHFPLRGASARAADAALLGSLKNWLAPEDSSP